MRKLTSYMFFIHWSFIRLAKATLEKRQPFTFSFNPTKNKMKNKMLSWFIKELLKSFSHFMAEAIRPVTCPAFKCDREILKVEVQVLDVRGFRACLAGYVMNAFGFFWSVGPSQNPKKEVFSNNPIFVPCIYILSLKNR